MWCMYKQTIQLPALVHTQGLLVVECLVFHHSLVCLITQSLSVQTRGYNYLLIITQIFKTSSLSFITVPGDFLKNTSYVIICDCMWPYVIVCAIVSPGTSRYCTYIHVLFPYCEYWLRAMFPHRSLSHSLTCRIHSIDEWWNWFSLRTHFSLRSQALYWEAMFAIYGCVYRFHSSRVRPGCRMVLYFGRFCYGSLERKNCDPYSYMWLWFSHGDLFVIL